MDAPVSGGTIGAATVNPLDECVGLVQEIVEAAKSRDAAIQVDDFERS